MRTSQRLCALAALLACAAPARGRGLESRDLLALRSVASVALSPDGARVAYAVSSNDGPGRPYRQLYVVGIADGRSTRVGGVA